MLSDAAFKYLQSLGAQQAPQDTPWSGMLAQNYSAQVPEQVPMSGENGSLPFNFPSQPEAPPTVQPNYAAEPAIPDSSGSTMQSSTAPNPEMLRIYKQMQQESNNAIGEQKGYLDRLKNYRSDLEKQPQEPDYTALMMASDAWNGTKFQPQYKSPMDENQKRALLQQADLGIAGQLGNISKEKLDALKTQEQGLMQTLKFSEAGNNKSSDQDEKDRQSLMKALDTEKSSGRFTPIGKAQGNVYQAQRIQALLDQYKKDPNAMPLTGPASLSEVAIGLNSLLSATGGSEESRKSLIPRSARGKYSTLEQFILNEPRGANMEAFVKNAQDTLKREQDTNQGQINKYRQKLEGAWGLGRYAKRKPDEFKKIVDFYTAPPESSDVPAGSSTNFSDAEKEKRYQEWKAKQK